MPAGRPSPSTAPARRRALALVVAAAALVGLAGCGSKPPPTDTRVVGVSSTSPEPFQEMRLLLTRLGRVRDARDAASARALLPEVLRGSKALLTMTPPHDLKRENVARFLDARARFTDGVNSFARSAAGSDDEALWASSRDLDSSFWAWFDAYRGRPSEGAV